MFYIGNTDTGVLLVRSSIVHFNEEIFSMNHRSKIRNFRYFCKMISVMPLSKFVFFKVYSATVKNRILWRFTQFFSHCISTYNVKIDSVLLQRAAAQITT